MMSTTHAPVSQVQNILGGTSQILYCKMVHTWSVVLLIVACSSRRACSPPISLSMKLLLPSPWLKCFSSSACSRLAFALTRILENSYSRACQNTVVITKELHKKYMPHWVTWLQINNVNKEFKSGLCLHNTKAAQATEDHEGNPELLKLQRTSSTDLLESLVQRKAMFLVTDSTIPAKISGCTIHLM